MTSLQKLIGHLPRYFDAEPAQQLTLRVSHPHGFAWSIADRILTAKTEADTSIGVYALDSMTITELADALTADGCLVTEFAEVGHLQADVLIDGSGRESESNGDHLYCYTSMLWSVLDAYSVVVDQSAADVVEALKEAYLHSSRGEWLDLWGDYFGVPRVSRLRLAPFTWSASETWTSGNKKWGLGLEPLTDEFYSPMVVKETIRPRSNAYAIERAVFELSGMKCRLREPWRDVMRLDDGRLDDRWHIYDATYWTWNVVQPVWVSHEKVADIDRATDSMFKSRPLGTLIVRNNEAIPSMCVTASLSVEASHQ